MKIIAINGSPQGKKSTTFFMVESFLDGMRQHGWTDQHILLSEMKIHHCLGCLTCWHNGGRCIFDDDMKKIPFLECDILLLASPLYLDNVSGLMKNFLDRKVSQANPLIGFDKNGECMHIKDRQAPKLIAMSNCGYPEQSQFEALMVLFRRMARNMDSELIGEIYRSQGPLLSHYDPDLTDVVAGYKALLKIAGSEIAQNFGLSEETKKRLEEPLIPHEAYLRGANSHNTA